jgi:hypothetical protein
MINNPVPLALRSAEISKRQDIPAEMAMTIGLCEYHFVPTSTAIGGSLHCDLLCGSVRIADFSYSMRP